MDKGSIERHFDAGWRRTRNDSCTTPDVPTFFPFASTVTTPGTKAAADANRPASRSVMATSEAPKAFAAKSETSPIGPAPVMSTRCPGLKPAFVHA